MKVVCDSCQAKYQVPDERVAGKKLKIRCKRCGATVLIRGDLLRADAGELAAGNLAAQGVGSESQDALDMSGADRISTPDAVALGDMDRRDDGTSIGIGGNAEADYEWHVSLDGDTQGPFSTDALRDWLNTTPGGWDAHVWREGFPDWLDARACAELGPAPAAPAMASLQQEEEVPTQTFSANSFEGAQFMAEVAAAPRGTQARAASEVVESDSRAQAGFGAASFSSSMSGASMSGSSAAGAAGGPGVRGATYTPGPNPGFATGEASGLIDIRALASLARQSTTQIAKNTEADTADGAVALSGAAAKSPSHGHGQGRSDAGLSFGNDEHARVAMANQPSGFGRLDSLAPVSHGVGSNAALPLAILGGCALVAAAVLAAVLFNKGKPSADTVAAPAPMAEHQQSASAATAMPSGEGMAAEPMEVDPAAADSEHDPSGDGEDVPAVAPADVEAAEDSEESELSKSKRHGSQGAAESDKDTAHDSASASSSSSSAADDKAKTKKDDASDEHDSAEAISADRAKPVKQAPQLTVTPLDTDTNTGVQTQSATDTEASKSAEVGKEAAKSVGTEPDPLLAAKPAAKSASSANRTLDELLSGATADNKSSAAPGAVAPSSTTNTSTTNTSTVAPETPVDVDLPDTPSRDETLAAMRGVESAVRACAENETVTGTAEVSINVAGGTGRVTSATVTGITGTVGSCIARAVRNARFPRFNKQTFSIKYPYRF